MTIGLNDDVAVLTAATFRLAGDHELTAAMVTQLLGIQPTLAGEAGDHVGSHSRAIRDSSLWCLSASGLPPDAELADRLHQLLDVLTQRRGTLWALARRGYHADWFCQVASHATEHAVELDRTLLRRLLSVPGDLLLDVASDD